MTELLTTKILYRNDLKEIITKVNNGTPIEAVKRDFNELLEKVGIQEFALIENELLKEGLPREKLEKLCDVHASMIPNFKFAPKNVKEIPGHPVNSYLNENKEILKLIKEIIKQINPNLNLSDVDEKFRLIEQINLLFDIEKHFLRKEMLLFPLLEQHGFDGPSKVMWSIHDTIRTQLKELKEYLLYNTTPTFDQLLSKFKILQNAIKNLIFKEENVLYPTSIQMLTEDEWRTIYNESMSYGYCLYVPEVEWKNENVIQGQNLLNVNFSSDISKISDFIKLPTGTFTPEQLFLLFSHLPISITFIDENDTVKFYSHGTNKIFSRTNAIIGRKVQNCHPPKSLHLVNQILLEFRNGEKNQADFWINHKGRFVYICFYPIFNENHVYKGTIEFVQDITYFKSLQGEKRIYS